MNVLTNKTNPSHDESGHFADRADHANPGSRMKGKSWINLFSGTPLPSGVAFAIMVALALVLWAVIIGVGIVIWRMI